ncbi:unnamed protein product [Trichogramma brassicae]|uniref:CARD domain-containing protein n=1 Tax=Trichogramma brassicae TaxID=86971 RepID=A0A6H5IHD3_9HYME|nr:unnamed protein product [Trichogramma brassicae]
MEQKHKEVLRRMRQKIVEDLDVYNGIIQPLMTEYVLKEEDANDIKKGVSKEERANILLDLLPERGCHAFEVFHQSLRHQYDWLSDDMDKLLAQYEPPQSRNNVMDVPIVYPNLPPVSPLTVTREEMICGSDKKMIYRWKIRSDEKPKSVKKLLFDAKMNTIGEENMVVLKTSPITITTSNGKKIESVHGKIISMKLNEDSSKLIYLTESGSVTTTVCVVLYDMITEQSSLIAKLDSLNDFIDVIQIKGDYMVLCKANNNLQKRCAPASICEGGEAEIFELSSRLRIVGESSSLCIARAYRPAASQQAKPARQQRRARARTSALSVYNRQLRVGYCLRVRERVDSVARYTRSD